MMKENEAKSSVEGKFRGIQVLILDKKLIRIYNNDNVPFSKFKPVCDRIAGYLIDEAFVSVKVPRIEIISP